MSSSNVTIEQAMLDVDYGNEEEESTGHFIVDSDKYPMLSDNTKNNLRDAESEVVYKSRMKAAHIEVVKEEERGPNIFKRLSLTPVFQLTIVAFVFLAGIIIGLQTDSNLRNNFIIGIFDDIVLLVFIFEFLVKFAGEYPKVWRYFLDSWNVFDFIIILAGITNFIYVLLADADNTGGSNSGGGAFLVILRLFRLLRVLKLLKSVRPLQILVTTMVNSIPSIGYISILLFILFYAYMCMGVMLFGSNDNKFFGNIGIAFVSLFRIMTGDGWSEIMYVEMYGCEKTYNYADKIQFGCENPRGLGAFAAFFFISFIFLGSFIALNLFIGVIMNNIESVSIEMNEELIIMNMAEKLHRNRERRRIDKTFDDLNIALEDIEYEMHSVRVGFERSIEVGTLKTPIDNLKSPFLTFATPPSFSPDVGSVERI